MMTATKDDLGIKEVTISEAAQTQMIEDVLEGVGVVIGIPKSLRTPRLEKDKKAMVSVRMSLRNLRHSRLTMAEKGKVVTIETDEEEEHL